MKEIIQRKISKNKNISDKTYKSILIILTSFVVFIVISSFLLIFTSGISFFRYVDKKNLFLEFIFGSIYNPSQGLFAAGFVAINTIWTSFLALVIAVPISVFTAIFITKFLPKRLSSLMFSIVAILAAIPSVIYGAFGQGWIDSIISPITKNSSSLLVIVLVLAFMIMPTITLMTITSINSQSKKLEESSIALGATKTQTSFKITLNSARNGVILGSLFGLGRALGEATAVSMIGASMQTGPTFNLFENTILLGPSIMNISAGDGVVTKDVSLFIYSMSGLLLATVLIVFILSKVLEHKFNEETIIKNNHKDYYERKNIFTKIEKKGIQTLDLKEQKKLIKISRTKSFNRKLYDFYNDKKESILIKNSRSINVEKKYLNYKKKEKVRSYFIMILFSIIGVLVLTGIIAFLFSSGTSYLTWEFLTSKGTITQDVYGLAIPLFGTIFTVILSLAIALPFGVFIGIYSGAYLKPNTTINRFISFSIQVMTSIPAVVYGIIAIIIFSNTIIDSNFKSFEPILMLSLVITPTIVKTTESGIKKVKKNQVDGSISLGATNFTTSRKIFVKEIIPSIVSAAVLAASIVIADSAIFLTIIGSSNANIDTSQKWIENGGWTLTTQMYFLSTASVKDWAQIKAVGIVIMIVILILSITSKLLEEKRMKEVSIFIFGNFLIFISILFVFFWMFILGIIIAFIGLLIIPLIDFLNKKYDLFTKVKYKFESMK